MKPHLLAFGGSVPTTSTFAAIPTITDTYATKTSAGMLLPQSAKALMAYVRGVNVNDARMNSPSIRAIGPPSMWPFDTAANPPNLPPLIRFKECGPIVPAMDALNVEVSTIVAVAADAQALILFGDGPPQPDRRSSRTIKLTGAGTGVVNAWVATDFILAQSLPAGRYAVVGFAAFGTGLLAARLIFNDQPERPGVPAQQAFAEYDDSDFRYGAFGEWGTFQNTALPTVEVLAYAANSAQTFFMDIVPVGR